MRTHASSMQKSPRAAGMRMPHLLQLSTPLGEIRAKPLFHACLLLRLVLDATHLLVRVLDITDVLTDAVDLRRLHIVLAQEAVPPSNKALDGLGLRHLLAIDFKEGQPAHVDIVFALRLGSIRLLPHRAATTGQAPAVPFDHLFR
jgi:hypothetical protein